jgi:urea carboxylase-associated protein 2
VSATADPKSAQAHARAQGGTRVEAMPTLPPAHAAPLPAGVEPSAMLWAETIAPGGYAAKRLARGARIELTDVQGDACASMLAFNAEQPVERLNVADTLKVQWNAYLGAGKLVLTDMGRVIFSILEDEAGTHDAFAGASNAASNARRYGAGDNWGPNPNARDRFMLALAKFGLARKDIHPCLNWFKGTRVAEDGGVAFEGGPFAPGRRLVLRAEMDVIVALANCPHVLDPRPTYTVTPLRVAAWRGAVTPEDDAIRTATPEGLRAFLNVEDYYRR